MSFPSKSSGQSGAVKIKIICLGDSAVGKSKLVERYLLGNYEPQQVSTYALTYFKQQTTINGEDVTIDLWDTAGQERFKKVHPAYYNRAHACILVFDTTRKITYKNLPSWYKELREHRPEIPVLCAGNKIDVNFEVTNKSFQFPVQHKMPFYFVSAADGTNVVKLFEDAIVAGMQYKRESNDFVDQVQEELDILNEKERQNHKKGEIDASASARGDGEK